MGEINDKPRDGKEKNGCHIKKEEEEEQNIGLEGGGKRNKREMLYLGIGGAYGRGVRDRVILMVENCGGNMCATPTLSSQ